MHVGSSTGNFAERGHLECAVIAVVAGDGESALVVKAVFAPGDAGVMEALVRESRANVTGYAVPFSTSSSVMSISLGFWMGSSACSSREPALPSQSCNDP